MIKRVVKIVIIVGLLFIFSIIGINVYIDVKTSDYIYMNDKEIENEQAIIILGAYVKGDTLSMVLEDRVEAGLRLYQEGISNKILLSGDHGQVEYDEVNGMRSYVIANSDIEAENIFLDHAGFDTYDSMYRAKEVYEIQSAVIVTQEFHVERAVYIARELGIDAVGYSVNQDKYREILQLRWFFREYLSRVKAFFDVQLGASPKYLGDHIPISGDGQLSWDEFDK